MTAPRVDWEWVRELLQRARSVGMSREDIALYAGKPHDLEAEVKRREPEGKGGWLEKMEAYKLRRKRLTAAYLAGASLGQLSALDHVKRSTLNRLFRREVAEAVLAKAAAERVGKGVQFTPTQVSAMFAAVSDEEVMRLPVITIAARMLKSAREVSEEDENDPYLRAEAGVEVTRIGEGSQRREADDTGEDRTSADADASSEGEREGAADTGADTLDDGETD